MLMNMFFVQCAPLSCYLVPLMPKVLFILLLNTLSLRSPVDVILCRTQLIMNVLEPLTAEDFQSSRDIGQRLRGSLMILDLRAKQFSRLQNKLHTKWNKVTWKNVVETIRQGRDRSVRVCLLLDDDYDDDDDVTKHLGVCSWKEEIFRHFRN